MNVLARRSGISRSCHIDALACGQVADPCALWQHRRRGLQVHRTGSRLEAAACITQSARTQTQLYRIGVVAFFLISGRFPSAPSRRRKRTFWSSASSASYPAYWLSVPLGALTGYWIWGRSSPRRIWSTRISCRTCSAMRAAYGCTNPPVELVFLRAVRGVAADTQSRQVASEPLALVRLGGTYWRC